MKIENDFLIFNEFTHLNPKKITGTTFGTLLGVNEYSKKGDGVLQNLGLYKSKVDPFFTKRGDIAEKIVAYKMKNKGLEIKTWDKEEIKFDNFPKNKQFGGMIDIAITSPYRCVVECKSKNISKLEDVKKNPNLNYEAQAKFYSYHSKCPLTKLVYVFFTDEQEKAIKEGHSINWAKENIKIWGYDIQWDEEIMQKQLEECLAYRNKCVNERRIPLEDISDEVLNYFNLKRF